MSLLGTSSSNSPLDNTRLMDECSLLPWIIDTGATLHATGTLACLFDQYEGLVSPVVLPAGGTTLPVVASEPIADVAASGSDDGEAELMVDVAASSSDLVVDHKEEAEVVSPPGVGSAEGGPMDAEVAVGSGAQRASLEYSTQSGEIPQEFTWSKNYVTS
ncbi:hypothetical protein LIER_10768 [Lithospermum erythrorhizon]|uniref:Uncharacterized protein n=1 Tax=Lithospermum erythrorhizon TaxID=34254 RepID=A0AAV3PPK2_LITER